MTGNSISINGDKINDLDFIINKSIAIENKYVIIRRGKKQYYLIRYN